MSLALIIWLSIFCAMIGYGVIMYLADRAIDSIAILTQYE